MVISDIILHLKAALMGVVEGFTEFLPISSTGHLILTKDLIHFDLASGFVFIIVIQTAALLAVMFEYRARLFHLVCGIFKDENDQRLAMNVLIGFMPVAILGVLLAELIERSLFTPLVTAMAFITGGGIILWIENRITKKKHILTVKNIDDITWRESLKIGLIQCLALIPGTSRSGATIIGGVFVGLSRTVATEFSFFLAMPAITGASVWSLWTVRDQLSTNGEWPYYLTASITAFIAAFICVRWLLKYISSHDFRVFAWYRIAFGGIILLTAYTGFIEWS